MDEESQLREKLRKIEALFAGAGTPGEKDAAAAALERLRSRLAALRASEEAVEVQFSLADPWKRKLFLALCRRYGLEPYRLYRQRYSTVMLKAPAAFIDQVLWPEYQELSEALGRYLEAVTSRIIREEVHRDITEAAETRQISPA